MSTVEFKSQDVVDSIFKWLENAFPDLAPQLAKLEDEVRDEFGGIDIYVPRRSAARRNKLTIDVLSHFNGGNATEVARLLGTSRGTVYRIIRQASKKK